MGSIPAEPTIDARVHAALGRLTDNEKECLRRRLQQQTAKEMALELGVSPHAVEKRLKMARTKLGLSSSLEAARLLAASEGYGRTCTQAPAPAATVHGEPKPVGLGWLAGGILATVFMTAALALALQSSGGVDAGSPQGSSSSRPADRGIAQALAPGYMPIARPEISAILQADFTRLDADRSGFLDVGELQISTPSWSRPWSRPVYRPDESGKRVPTGETIELTAERLRADFLAELDRDGNARVSFAEYSLFLTPRLARLGIPTGWRENMNRPIRPDG
jgi:DNA-binding CsgD family transcriptional regulator